MAVTRTTFSGLKIGQRFKVIKNSNSHNYIVGETYAMSRKGTATMSMNNIAKDYPKGNILYFKDIIIITNDLFTMESDLKTFEEEFKAKSKDLKSKIAFCKKHCLDEFDDNTFKVYQTLSILNTTSSDIEKAQVIAKLIKD